MSEDSGSQHTVFFARQTAKKLFNDGVSKASPEEKTFRALYDSPVYKEIQDKKYNQVHILALGKASIDMVMAARSFCARQNIHHKKITFLCHDFDHGLIDDHTRCYICGHPIPDERSVVGAKELMKTAGKAVNGDLCLVLISGGGSAMACSPAGYLELSDKMQMNQLLLSSGATINEINTVRKHLSAFKGGYLAEACYPARSHVLVISDVIGDDLSTIASGPMSPDPTTYADAWAVIEKYDLSSSLPERVRSHLKMGLEGQISDTPKADDPIFNQVTTQIVASTIQSIQAMTEEIAADAKLFGIKIIHHPDPIDGEARIAAKKLVDTYRHRAKEDGKAVVVVGGGETTVTVKGVGKGGRNQEMALAFAIEAEKKKLKNFVFLSGGTDGRDGPTDAAGGIVDDRSLARMRSSGINPQENLTFNDSNPALKAAGDLLITGTTLTNVADLQVLILWP